MRRVFIIHGWEGSPEANWFPWLKEELSKKGIEAIIPVMPNSAHPKRADWVAELKKQTGEVDSDTYFVGHSLGAITVLLFLQDLPEGVKAGGAILVAGFPGPIEYDELNSFFEKPLDFENIRQKAQRVVVIDSDNDPYVPAHNAEMLEKKLHAKRVTIKEGGHLNADDGYTEFPEVLESLFEMINIT